MHRTVTCNFSRLYHWSTLFLMVGVPSLLYGQSDIPQFNLIRTPLSPVFTLLDAAPAAVERPNTPSALAISILSNSSELTQLPANYSLEISPCWLFDQPDLTWEKDASRNISESVWRTLSVSLGTVRTGDSSSKATALAFGMRTSIVSGVLSDRSRQKLLMIRDRLTAQAEIFYNNTIEEKSKIEKAFSEQLQAAGEDQQKQKEAIQKYNDAISKITKQEIEQNDIQDFAAERHGFFLDLAVAGAWQFASDKADSGKFMRFGTWLTPAYKWQNWSIVGVGRVLMDKIADTTTHTTWDAGASVIYTVGRYGVSLEAVQRNFTWENAPDNIFRLAMIFDAEVEKGMWITATLGRTYTETADGALLAQLGLSFNINPQRYHN